MNRHTDMAKRLVSLGLITGAAGLNTWTVTSGTGGWAAYSVFAAVILIAMIGLIRPDRIKLTDW